MKTPYKHAEIIKAWADGADIEVQTHSTGPWIDFKDTCQLGCVAWSSSWEYRIKPEPKPDVVWYMVVSKCGSGFRTEAEGLAKQLLKSGSDVLSVTFDGETGKLKSAEVLK